MNLEDLHILMLEDNQLDAELNIEQLRLLEEYNCIIKVVQEKDEYIKEIGSSFPPDLILCDYNLPQYNGMEALKDLNSRQLIIPFIFVTGTMQEEVAAGAIKAGAWDYVVKDRLFRLPLAVRSVLNLRKEKEITLEAEKKSHRLLKAIEETSAQIVVLDKFYNIEYINKNFTNVTGYTTEEVLGTNISNYFSPKITAYNSIKQLLEKREVFKEDILNVKKNGQEYWEHLSVTPIFNSNNDITNYIIIKEDITQQKKTEKDLVVSEERLHLALTGADLGLWDWNIVTGDLVVNGRWAEMLGYTLDEIIPNVSTWERLLHPDDVKDVMIVLNEHLNGETEYYASEHRLKTKNEHWKWILDRGKVISRDKNGKPLRAAGTHMDITDRKQAENQLNQTVEEYLSLNEELTKSLNQIESINQDLKIAKQKAEESDKLKTAFLANLSHEIRTPMNGILGFADLLKGNNLSQAMRNKYIDVIEQSGERMLKLINDLVDISKIEANQVEINLERTNLNDLMDKVFNFFKPLTDKKGLSLSHEKGLQNNECAIIVDSLKLEQILTNLINNALKFTEKGGISFSYSLSENKLVFNVKDTGAGIPAGMENLIFERFRQVENTYYRGTEGSGLGLSISKAFIELMGGNIWLNSGQAEGSTFIFTLPYTPAEILKKENEKESDHLFDEGTTILVAEDDFISYLFLEQILLKNNFKILHANDGYEAVRMLDEHSEIELILMDMKMPQMNGIDATLEIRKKNLDIPILAQTAYASDDDKQKAIAAGCNDVVNKPIKKDELLTKMESLLSMRQS